jgi:hypothetical protein
MSPSLEKNCVHTGLYVCTHTQKSRNTRGITHVASVVAMLLLAVAVVFLATQRSRAVLYCTGEVEKEFQLDLGYLDF